MKKQKYIRDLSISKHMQAYKCLLLIIAATDKNI